MVVRNFRTTILHGAIPNKTQEREVKGYNLDVIIPVGYRVKSQQGTQFQIWATQKLKSDNEFEKFKVEQKKLEQEQSLNEIEADIKKLKGK